MLTDFLSKTVDLATAPARKIIDTGKEAVSLARNLPTEVGNLAHEFRLAQREAEQDIQQMMQQIDSSFDRDVSDMTTSEREAAAMMELAKAEQHLSGALFSLLKVMRLALAESTRVIDHDDIVQGRIGRQRR